MYKIIIAFIINPVKVFFKQTLTQIREINRKYAIPQIKTTKLVRISLLILRGYLILLLGILVYKFITLL